MPAYLSRTIHGYRTYLIYLSAFIPTNTMPSSLPAFAKNLAMSSLSKTLQGLLPGTPIGNTAARFIDLLIALIIAVQAIMELEIEY